jgi:hypothetical protein
MRKPLTLAALAIVACSSLQVHQDWDPAANFNNFRTYQWKDATPVKNQLLDQRIVQAVNQQLAAKGLKQVDSGADLFVTYHGSVSEQLNYQTTGYGYGMGGWYGPGYGGVGVSNTTVQQIPIGTLVIDLVDVKTNQMVWRSTASDDLRQSDNPQQAQSRIDNAVKAMFSRWPETNKS